MAGAAVACVARVAHERHDIAEIAARRRCGHSYPITHAQVAAAQCNDMAGAWRVLTFRRALLSRMRPGFSMTALLYPPKRTFSEPLTVTPGLGNGSTEFPLA